MVVQTQLSQTHLTVGDAGAVRCSHCMHGSHTSAQSIPTVILERVPVVVPHVRMRKERLSYFPRVTERGTHKTGI